MRKTFLFVLMVVIVFGSVLNAQVIQGSSTTSITQKTAKTRNYKLKAFGGYGMSWYTVFGDSDPIDSFNLGMSVVFQDEDVQIAFEPGIRYINKGYTYDITRRIDGIPVKGKMNYHNLDAFCKLHVKMVGSLSMYSGFSFVWSFTSSYEYSSLLFKEERIGYTDEFEVALPFGLDLITKEQFVLNLEFNYGVGKIVSKDENHFSNVMLFSIGVMF